MNYQAIIKNLDGTSFSSDLYPTDGQAVASIMRPHQNPDSGLMVTTITGDTVEVAYITTLAKYRKDTE